MSKVIVERPRRPGYDGGGANRGRAVDHDLMVSHEGMRAPHVRHYGGKELNENLAPLRRFIQSRVGRRWDDVYSEISENLKVTSAVQQHVRDHVEDFVAVRTRMVNGEIWITSRWGSPHPLREGWKEFYVDPRDGILRVNEHRETYTQRQKRYREQRKAEEAATIRSTKDGKEYRKLGGIWYEVIWDQVPPPSVHRYTNPVTGEVTERELSYGKTDVFTGKTHRTQGEWYRAGKRQLAHDELKRNGLTND